MVTVTSYEVSVCACVFVCVCVCVYVCVCVCVCVCGEHMCRITLVIVLLFQFDVCLPLLWSVISSKSKINSNCKVCLPMWFVRF